MSAARKLLQHKEMKSFLRWLRLHGACGLTVGCGEGMDLVRRYATPAEWWSASERGDDMLWLAGRVEIRRQDLVLAACACARLALPHVPKGEERPFHAIETAERWARGEEGVTLTMVRDAAHAAYAAYDAAYDASYAAAYAADAAYDASYAAAYAAAYAADAAYDAPYAAAHAAYAAYDASYAAAHAAAYDADAAYDAPYDAYAAYAAYDASYAAAHAAAYDANAARSATLKACADLVRAQIPWSMIERAMTESGKEGSGT